MSTVLEKILESSLGAVNQVTERPETDHGGRSHLCKKRRFETRAYKLKEGGCLHTRRSTGEYVLKLEGANVRWASRVALWSCESEYMEARTTAKESVR